MIYDLIIFSDMLIYGKFGEGWKGLYIVQYLDNSSYI